MTLTDQNQKSAQQPDRAIIFCHGVPGGPSDIKSLTVPLANFTAISPNYLSNQYGSPLVTITSAVDVLSVTHPDAQLEVVGFSVGAMYALKAAAARPNHIRRVTLISPAAPLQLGDFLPAMAGSPVFKLAAKSPRLLGV